MHTPSIDLLIVFLRCTHSHTGVRFNDIHGPVGERPLYIGGVFVCKCSRSRVRVKGNRARDLRLCKASQFSLVSLERLLAMAALEAQKQR